MTRLYLAAGAVLLAIIAVGGVYLKGRTDGRAIGQAEIVKQIEKENTNAGNKAEDWRSAFRRCLDGGGVFDFETGTCES